MLYRTQRSVPAKAFFGFDDLLETGGLLGLLFVIIGFILRALGVIPNADTLSP